MTKSELILSIADRLKLPTGKAEVIVNTVFDSMTAALVRGDRIEIRDFGVFEVRNYDGYEGRNPKTGATVNVAPKKLPFFKVGKHLQQRVNHEPTEGVVDGVDGVDDVDEADDDATAESI